VILHDGTGYLTSALPALGPGRTYQLWGARGTSVVSLGVLGPHPSVAAFSAAGRPSSLAITDEVAGGVAVSRNAPTAVGDVSAS